MRVFRCLIFVCLCVLCACDLLPEPTATSGGTRVDIPLPDLSRAERATVTSVIDGDTINVRMNGQTYRVRYVGVNTPERDEACYNEARNANVALVAGQEILMLRDRNNTDQYDRLLRYIFVGERFVNAELIANGWAEAVEYNDDRRFTADFRRLERAAAAARLGCHPTGIFDDGSDIR